MISLSLASQFDRRVQTRETGDCVARHRQYGLAHFGPQATGHQHIQERAGPFHTPPDKTAVSPEQDKVRSPLRCAGQPPAAHHSLGGRVMMGLFARACPALPL